MSRPELLLRLVQLPVGVAQDVLRRPVAGSSRSSVPIDALERKPSVSSESAAPRDSFRREASAGSVSPSTSPTITAYSSPPYRATKSCGRDASSRARAARQEKPVAGQVAPRVVPLLETVDVGEEKAEAPPLASPECLTPFRDLAVQRIAVPESRPPGRSAREPVAPHLFRHPPEDGGRQAEKRMQEDDAPRRVEIHGSRSRDEARDRDDRHEERHVAPEIGPCAPAAAPRGGGEPGEKVEEERCEAPPEHLQRYDEALDPGDDRRHDAENGKGGQQEAVPGREDPAPRNRSIAAQ